MNQRSCDWIFTSSKTLPMFNLADGFNLVMNAIRHESDQEETGHENNDAAKPPRTAICPATVRR